MKSTKCDCGKNCSCKNCLCSPYALFFDTLGNETRLFVLNSLQKKPKNVGDIVNETGLEQTHVSHSLKRLEQCEFVTKKRKGKFMEYAINKKTIAPLLSLIDEHVQQYCAHISKPCICGRKK